METETKQNIVTDKEIDKIKDILHKITVSVGYLIKEKRLKYKLSILDLAKASHVSSTVITDLENARSLPKLEVLMKLVTALGIPFNALFEKFKIETPFTTYESKSTKPTLEEMIKLSGLNNIDTKDVLEFIEFKKYKNSKKK